jgi:hypothetical protein
MANVLPMEKKISVISALAEGQSIRAAERMLGIHRDTIMRLGVRVGQGCERLLDSLMRNLAACNCRAMECRATLMPLSVRSAQVSIMAR